MNMLNFGMTSQDKAHAGELTATKQRNLLGDERWVLMDSVTSAPYPNPETLQPWRFDTRNEAQGQIDYWEQEYGANMWVTINE